MFVEARKLGVVSSGPELDPGLLLGREEARNEPWLWLDPGRWLEPGRLDPERETGLFCAESGSKNADPCLFRAGDDGNWASVSKVLSASDNLGLGAGRVSVEAPQSASVAFSGAFTGVSLRF